MPVYNVLYPSDALYLSDALYFGVSRDLDWSVTRPVGNPLTVSAPAANPLTLTTPRR